MSENGTHTWPELAIGLFEQLTGKNAEIIYSFEDMSIQIPSGTGSSAKLAPWKLDGTMRIRTKTHERSVIPSLHIEADVTASIGDRRNPYPRRDGMSSSWMHPRGLH